MPRRRPFLPPAALTAAAALATSCALLPRPLRAPDASEATVLLISGGLPAPMEKIARHPWFATRRAGATTWETWEVGGGHSQSSDPFHNDPYLEPILNGIWRGKEAEAAIACIEANAPAVYGHIESHYMAWPGPNSNTFGDVMLRKCHLHASLPGNAIGKDYRGWFGAGISSEGTGVQVETPVLGMKVGLKEGVEVHVLGLAFGVDLWPPAIIVPFGSGRIGFADR